jgi:hypothetical protein
MWHCPHCGAPQAETARCWVCRRSSTTCSTCTHFRRALAGDLGYCGLDARRRPLTGVEQRGCWEPKTTTGQPVGPHPTVIEEPHRLRGGRPIVQAYRGDGTSAPRDFVPLESLPGEAAAPVRRVDEPADIAAELEPVPAPPLDPPAPPAFVIEPDPGWGQRTSLFGDPEV